MNRFNDILHSLGIDIGLLIAGIFSVLAGLKKMIQEPNTWARLGYIFTALGSAIYLTPLLINLLGDTVPENGGYGMGFIVGYSSKKSIEYFTQSIKLRVNK